MKRMTIVLTVAIVLSLAGFCRAESLWERDSVSNGFWGLNDRLADHGIELGLGITEIYQQNVHGGMNTNRRQGRHSGSYDLEASADLQRLLGIEGGSLYMHAKGGWSRSDVDTASVGSMFGVNADAGGRRTLDIVQFWYEQALAGETLRIRLGKFDITGGFECRGCPVSFDGSAFANDETAQFMNGALVNNPTIPFPDYGLGVIVYWNPVESWYASLGVIDAQADGRETGFRTTFHDQDYFFYVFETGVTPQFNSANGPLQGAYRFGLWFDPQPKMHSDAARSYRDDTGFYVSCDQMIAKENADPEDGQGLGVFGRYGHANSRRNDVTNFWSIGFQYQGLIDGRDDDVLGIGFAQGTFSDKATATYLDDNEKVLEVYYNAQVTPWLNITPNIQYIANPAGTGTVKDAVVVGVRAQMVF